MPTLNITQVDKELEKMSEHNIQEPHRDSKVLVLMFENAEMQCAQ